MTTDKKIDEFLSNYSEEVFVNSLKLREVLFANLPGIMEQIDIPAKMIAYCYGQKYSEMICTIIPSKKGLKLGFYKGVDLPDPTNLLEGTGKLSRYIEIRSDEQIKSPALKKLIESALDAYKKRINSYRQ
ncbi:MAG: DUF1801 domain-containing protein [Bacteroidetes bacterium]|nr:MAG: DUF1801 domain-containing protein [Bacteroidota bacterium]